MKNLFSKKYKKESKNFALFSQKWYSDFMTLFTFVSLRNSPKKLKGVTKQGGLT